MNQAHDKVLQNKGHTKMPVTRSRITAQELKRLRGKQFLEASIEYHRSTFEDVVKQNGYDISDHAPAKLGIIDDHLMGSAEDACVKEGVPLDSGVIWSAYHGLGSYFGTVLVLNLGGRWQIPSGLRLWLSTLLQNPAILFDHWYVELNGIKIPVFKIARLRWDGSGRIKSLSVIYEKITKGDVSWDAEIRR